MQEHMMRAAYYERFGGPEVIKIGMMPKPVCTDQQILIKVAATSYNAFDGYMRTGALGEVQFPHIPHVDFSGIIEEIGMNVREYKIGDRVFGVLLPDFFQNSCAAEYIAIDPTKIPLALAPANCSLEDCAAVPAAALTAYQGIMEHCKLKKGNCIYIAGGAGGVGSFAVQFAKRMGAFIISSGVQESAHIISALGADVIFDYTIDSLSNACTKPIDAIFCAAPLSQQSVTELLPYVKRGGRLVATLNAADEIKAKQFGVNAMVMAVQSNTMYLKAITKMLEAGEIVPNIYKRFTFKDIVKANEEALHSHGKIVIYID